MVLWLSKAPFNSLFYGYAYSKQIVIFYNNLWGLRSNAHVWMPMHACMNDCSWHGNWLLVVTSSIRKKKPRNWFKQKQQPFLVVNNNKMCFDRRCYSFYGNLWLQLVCGRAQTVMNFYDGCEAMAMKKFLCFCLVLCSRHGGMRGEPACLHWWMMGWLARTHICLYKLKDTEEGGRMYGLPQLRMDCRHKYSLVNFCRNTCVF